MQMGGQVRAIGYTASNALRGMISFWRVAPGEGWRLLGRTDLSVTSEDVSLRLKSAVTLPNRDGNFLTTNANREGCDLHIIHWV